MLEGSNYLVWADAMKSYLKSQGLWQVVTGGYLAPDPPAAAATSAITKQYTTDLLDWSNKDDAAFGTIMLRVTPPMQTLISGLNNSRIAWEALATSLGVQGPALVHSDFKQTLQIKISPSAPAMDISKMATIFNRLEKNQDRKSVV